MCVLGGGGGGGGISPTPQRKKTREVYALCVEGTSSYSTELSDASLIFDEITQKKSSVNCLGNHVYTVAMDYNLIFESEGREKGVCPHLAQKLRLQCHEQARCSSNPG